MKKVLLVVKNKRSIKNRVKRDNLSNKRGSELAQTVLITAVMITIIAALFFPQLKTLFSSAMTQITEWFNTVIGNITKV